MTLSGLLIDIELSDDVEVLIPLLVDDPLREFLLQLSEQQHSV